MYIMCSPLCLHALRVEILLQLNCFYHKLLQNFGYLNLKQHCFKNQGVSRLWRSWSQCQRVLNFDSQPICTSWSLPQLLCIGSWLLKCWLICTYSSMRVFYILVAAAYFVGLPSRKYNQKKRKSVRHSRKVTAAATAVVAAPPEEVKEYVLFIIMFVMMDSGESLLIMNIRMIYSVFLC